MLYIKISNMLTYENHFLKIVDFLKKYECLIDCHLVDFLTENLWETCLPKDLRLYIEEKGPNVIAEIEQFNELNEHYNSSRLYMFLKSAKLLHLENCSDILNRNNFLNILKYKDESVKPIQSEYMKVKKWHEVDVFTKTIVWLNENKSSIIIDAGAGKGYSSLHLSTYYNLPVLAVECSQINHKGAILHRDLINKKSKLSIPLIEYAVEQIDETTNFVQMVKDHFPDLYLHRELVLTALHACGSLTDSVIRSFSNVSDVKCLCVVPCCYHLASQALLGTYEFSKNSRMLAQQSIDRIKQNNVSFSPSLFYRAILQVLLKFSGVKDVRIGRGAPVDSFLTYAKWALKKIDATEVPSDEIINRHYEEYKCFEWKFTVFQLLRIQLAPVIESAIILDKVLFMQKSKVCTKLKVVQLFDPLLSPRNWAIIATK